MGLWWKSLQIEKTPGANLVLGWPLPLTVAPISLSLWQNGSKMLETMGWGLRRVKEELGRKQGQAFIQYIDNFLEDVVLLVENWILHSQALSKTSEVVSTTGKSILINKSFIKFVSSKWSGKILIKQYSHVWLISSSPKLPLSFPKLTWNNYSSDKRSFLKKNKRTRLFLLATERKIFPRNYKLGVKVLKRMQ